MRTRRTAIAAAVIMAALLSGCSAEDDRGTSRGAAPHGGQRPPALEGRPPAQPGPVAAQDDPVSTFAVDVDTASYTLARRALLAGQRPDPSAVRIEEFVNYFNQDYPEPDGDGIGVSVDGGPTPFTTHPEQRVVRVGLQTRRPATGERKDAVLVFVIDVSGSMADPGKLDLVKTSLLRLVDQLRPTDRVGLVVYGSTARVVLPVTDGRARGTLRDAVESLQAEGSTNLEEGLVLGYQLARESYRPEANNRVVLASDGIANVGNTTAEPILEQVREYAGKGIAMVTAGFGVSNNDPLMEQLADNGDGFYAYVDDAQEGERLFVERLTSTLEMAALDAKVQVEFDRETVRTYRLLGFENRQLRDREFRDDQRDAGDLGAGHSVTALYEVELASSEPAGQLGEVRVRWLDPAAKEPTERATPIELPALANTWEQTPLGFRVATVAAAFAERLQERGEHGWAQLTELADEIARASDDPEIHELARLVRLAAEGRR